MMSIAYGSLFLLVFCFPSHAHDRKTSGNTEKAGGMEIFRQTFKIGCVENFLHLGVEDFRQRIKEWKIGSKQLNRAQQAIWTLFHFEQKIGHYS